MNKKVQNKGGEIDLTKTEREISHFIDNEYLTAREIAIRRKTSKSAVYKIIRSLKKKGALNIVHKNAGTFEPKLLKNQIRLHGEEINIKILYKDKSYEKLIRKPSNFILDRNRIHLYKNSIKIYSGQSFYADAPEKALYNSMPYWNRFLVRLENNLKVLFLKGDNLNIRIVKVHFAETQNEIAKEYEASGDSLKIYAREDGKLWLTIDNSFKLQELETSHSKTAQPDITRVTKHLNDWREHDSLTSSEITKIIGQITKQDKKTSEIQKNTCLIQQNISNQLKLTLDLLFPKQKINNQKQEKDWSYFG